MDGQSRAQDSSSIANPSASVDDKQVEHHIEPDCEQLLRKSKKQVKRLMEEAVTRKFIHVESGGLISLCVAVDACLTHGLRRRVLGLFKTSSSMALVHKMAKSCPAAQKILQSVEEYKLSLLMAEQKHQQQQQQQSNCNSIVSKLNDGKQQQQVQVATSRRFLWIKLALMEGRLVEIVEYLGKNASKFYEQNALMSDYLCAQILCSLLVGPSALEFTRDKLNEFQFQEDPTAFDLVKRHKLANPIACACKQHQMSQKDCDNNNNTPNGTNNELTSNDDTHGTIKDVESRQYQWSRPNSMKSSKSSGRRRPLSIKTNANRPLVMTECHHYSCQDISEHKQLRGYSMQTTSQCDPLSAPSTSQRASCSSTSSSNQQRLQQASSTQLLNSTINNTQQNQQERKSCNSKDASNLQQQQQQQVDNSWSLWSPRVLHEIMCQNSRSQLIYAKNNILIESETNKFVPGYLSLHETDKDLILKWTPNQMINGSQCNERQQPQDEASQDVDEDDCLNSNGTSDSRQEQQDSMGCNNYDKKNQNNWGSIKDPTPIESSYLDLVVSIPISSIVLLHCHFRASSIDCVNLSGDDASITSDTVHETKRIEDENHDNLPNPIDPGSPSSSSQETLILVEADGIQRAPFRFPKGGLRLFLSCLEAGLAPNKFLDPAISLDMTSQWPQHPVSRNYAAMSRISQSRQTSSGRSTPLGHSSSLGADSETTSDNQMTSSSLGRFDSLLRRFPSLRRARNQRHSDSNDDSTSIIKNDVANDETPKEPSMMESKFEKQLSAPTNNYIYRIVSLQQSDWVLPTPPDCSSPSVSSPSYFTNNNNNKNRNLMPDLGGFRWNLRRWTNFARPGNQTSSISTLSSSFGQANRNDTDSLDNRNNADNPQQRSLDSGDLSFEEALNDCSSGCGEDQDRVSIGCDNNVATPGINLNSLKLASIEAKLNDLKKSTSEEILETFRTQSIETLCKSMRKQIVARAFYGWLVHCRRAKLIRKHLSHLLNLQQIQRQQERSQLQADPTIDILSEQYAQNEAFSSGLTRAIWEELMLSEQAERDCESSELVAQKVSLHVYFGGIESNELRKSVWPFLLKYYLYSDEPEVRQRKHAEARRAYEDCATEWVEIEQEVVRRDNEILAANIARAKRESINSSRLRNCSNSDMSTNQIDNHDKGSLKVAEVASKTTTKATSGAEAGNQQTCMGEDTVSLGAASICNLDEKQLSSNVHSGLKDSTEGLPAKGESLSDHDRGDGDGDNYNDDDMDSNSNEAKIANDEENEDTVGRNQRSLGEKKGATRQKRWRLESTGSLGSDAPIIDQFGNNIHRIDKDVQRCDRNFWYFKKKENLNKLRNIMCTYVWQNLKSGYVQGMCDLAAPFLVILDDEFDAFQCYDQLMVRMVDNFPLGSAMDKNFEALRYLLQVMDPKLFQVLQCENEDNSCFYFCYRWLLLDFKRELPYGDVYLVWETIWAARDVATDHFVVFLAFAMVRYYRDIIIENNMDYTDTLKFFNEMAERHDIKRILRLARESVAELYYMMVD